MNLRLIQIFSVLLLICLPSCSNPKKPSPLTISFKEAMLTKGQKAIITNPTNRHLSCKLSIKNETHKTKSSYSFSLSPHDSITVGSLEMSWKFESGEKGLIEVEGCEPKPFVVP